MAGLGEFYSLDDAQLRTAFNEAKADGKDYLVKVSYTSDGAPMGMPGFSFMLDMIDFHEAAHGVSADETTEDLRAIYQKHGPFSVIGVYDLATPFSNVVTGDQSLLPQDALKTIEAEIEKDRYDAAMKARPLWKKLLGFRP